MIRLLTTSRLSIALRRKKRDAPVAGAVRTLGAGFGIEALAEVVTATAVGDKARARARADQAPGSTAFGETREPPSSARVT
jgi:hypothetical protein